MIYTLILIFAFDSSGGSSSTIDFNTRQECDLAGQKSLEHFYKNSHYNSKNYNGLRRIDYFCVEKSI